MATPQIQVGVDWDGDNYINWGGVGYTGATHYKNQLTDGANFHGCSHYVGTNTTSIVGPISTNGIAVGTSVDEYAGYRYTITNITSANKYLHFRDTNNSAVLGYGHKIVVPAGPNAVTLGYRIIVRQFGAVAENVRATIELKATNSPAAATVAALTTAYTNIAPSEFGVISGAATVSIPAGTYFVKTIIHYNTINSFNSVVIQPMVAFSTANVVTDMSNYLASNYNNGGVEYAYEDITKYVLTANWKIGSDDPKDQISSSGSGFIDLDNTSRIFYPNNSSSPLYDNMFPNRRVIIRMYNQATGKYEIMFQGLVDSFDLISSSPLEKRVRINLVQPVFNLLDSNFVYPIDDYGKTTLPVTSIETLLLKAFNMNEPSQSFYNPTLQLGTSKLGQDCFIGDSMGVQNIGSSFLDLSYVGAKWGNLSFTDFLKGVVRTEHGWLIVARDGRFQFFDTTRLRVGSPEHATAINLNLNLPSSGATEFSISYGDDVRNTITGEYLYTADFWAEIRPERKEAADTDPETDKPGDDFYWPKKTNIPLGGFSTVKRKISTVVISPNQPTFEPPEDYDKDQTETPNKWDETDYGNLGGVPENLYEIDWVTETDRIYTINVSEPLYINGWSNMSVVKVATPSGSAESRAYYSPDLYNLWKMGKKDPSKLRLIMANPIGGIHANPLIDLNPISVRGKVRLVRDYQTLTVREPIAGQPVRGWSIGKTFLESKTRLNRLISLMLLDFNSYAVQVDTITLVATDSNDPAYTNMLGMYPSRMVNLTEIETGLSSAAHVIIGEEYEYAGGTIKATYSCVDVQRRATNSTVNTFISGGR